MTTEQTRTAHETRTYGRRLVLAKLVTVGEPLPVEADALTAETVETFAPSWARRATDHAHRVPVTLGLAGPVVGTVEGLEPRMDTAVIELAEDAPAGAAVAWTYRVERRADNGAITAVRLAALHVLDAHPGRRNLTAARLVAEVRARGSADELARALAVEHEPPPRVTLAASPWRSGL